VRNVAITIHQSPHSDTQLAGHAVVGTLHTAVSWAAAVGNVEAINILLEHGATVGWGDDMQVR
jgi:hypothetical protein